MKKTTTAGFHEDRLAKIEKGIVIKGRQRKETLPPSIVTACLILRARITEPGLLPTRGGGWSHKAAGPIRLRHGKTVLPKIPVLYCVLNLPLMAL